jgi:hypothetical protein
MQETEAFREVEGVKASRIQAGDNDEHGKGNDICSEKHRLRMYGRSRSC